MWQPQNQLQNENYNSANLKVKSKLKEKSVKSENLHCFNHAQRVATYTLTSLQTNEKVFYCQKCAIIYASKGFPITKLEGTANTAQRNVCPIDQSMPKRQQEIEQFLRLLCCQIKQMNKKGSQAQYSLRISSDHFNNLIEQTSRYFQEIQDIIQIQKFVSLNSILNQRAALENQLRMMRTSLQSQIQLLTDFWKDIQNNMEAVESVEENIYESIMQNYKNKLNLSYQFNQFKIDILMIPRPAIALPDIPKSLYSLAEKITLKADNHSFEEIDLACVQSTAHSSLNQRSSKLRPRRQNSKKRNHKTLQNQSNNKKAKKSFTKMPNTKNIQNTNSQEKAFSFDDHPQNCLKIAENSIHQVIKKDQNPSQFQYDLQNQSFNLNQIRQNNKYDKIKKHKGFVKFLQDIIPEEMVSSHQQFPGDYVPYILSQRHSNDADSKGEDTQNV